MTYAEKEKIESIENIKVRLEEMGYEYISSDSDCKRITYKCKRCGEINIAYKNIINKEYIRNRWKLCSSCQFSNIPLETLIEECKKTGNTKSTIGLIKASKYYISELQEMTSFLNAYDADVNERVYCAINNITTVEQIACPYCGKKKKWSGKITEGYKDTCCSKECESEKRRIRMTGSTHISENRTEDFKRWQAFVTEINDDIIKEKIVYDKYVEHIDNPIIVDYLEHRFKDSDSLLETVQRIKFGVEHKPICANPNCNHPVKWNGHPSKLYYRYCCPSCSAQSEETQHKAQDTNLKKYGSTSYVTSNESKQKCMEEYGHPYMFQSKDVINKLNEIKLNKFGSIYPTQNEAVKEKMKNTFIDRYGVPTSLFLPEVREKAYSEESRQKRAETTQKHYGVPCMFLDPATREKCVKAMNDNSRNSTSKKEIEIYNIIDEIVPCEHHHYDKEIFPFNVDYYIPDYDVFIEYQGSMFHNTRAFFGTDADLKEVEILKEKAHRIESEMNKESQYSAEIYQWTDLDVRKRELADKLGLNYLEIYSYHDEDDIRRQISLYLNCLLRIKPLVYSPETIKAESDYYKNLHISNDDEMSSSVTGQKNIIVKNYQFCEFYKKEMELYAHNPVIRRKLIQNRMKYLGKKEHELTVSDIFTGFKKSGIYYGYSHFNPAWTNWFVNKYDIRVVYDPCGGWGHHLLGMLSCARIIYNDFNAAVCDNIRKMKDELGLDNLEIHNEDAQCFYPESGVDGWFMCPPYYNLEIYNDKEFKDMADYKKFLYRIFNNWCKSSARVFGVVIREDFISLIDYEPAEIYELSCGEIHYNKNAKKHKEKFYIFKKEQD